MNEKKTIVVIGAGPAGMMAAGTAAQSGAEVFLLEKNKRVGRKLLITGKGRCNITNNCDVKTMIESVPSNGKFLYSALNRFSPRDTIRFFEEKGLPLKTERGNRVFPESDRALDVVETLYQFVKHARCKLLSEKAMELIINHQTIGGVKLEDGRVIETDAVIVTCGGMSYPLTGSTGDGYRFARQAGHQIIDPKPSLIPLVSHDTVCKNLQGLSLKNISITVKDQIKRRVVYKDFGELLFTHFGLSGPVILSASAHMRQMKQNRYTVLIDLKPALSIEKLDVRIQRDLQKYQNKALCNALCQLLPRKLIPIVIEKLGVDPQTKCNQITKKTRQELCRYLKMMEIPISGFRPIEEAIVTAGGVKTSEIDPKTMQSKLIKGLYFAGEVIDIDAYTGGFNLQIAFSTGFLAGNSAAGGEV